MRFLLVIFAMIIIIQKILSKKTVENALTYKTLSDVFFFTLITVMQIFSLVMIIL